jgi:16S rRNA (guanine527-N7)-methyltransferase
LIESIFKKNIEKFEYLENQVMLWSRTLNLVSRETLKDLAVRHIRDSLQLVAWLPVESAEIVDLGSGGGFPGLVLAIAGYGPLVLVESDQRKSVFLNQMIRSMSLNAKVLCDRAENLGVRKASFGVSRAFACLSKTVRLLKPLLDEEGVYLLHKGRHVKKELEIFQREWYGECEIFPGLVCPDSFIVKIAHASPRSPDHSRC